VTVRQDPSVGIPGVVYDCAVHLAAFVVDEVFPKQERSGRSDEREGGPVRVLELGAGTGACGCLLAAACARRNVEIHLTLTDRKHAALALCAANLAANARVSGSEHEKKLKNYATRRYAFGDPIDDLLRDPIEDSDSRVPPGVAHDAGNDAGNDDAREARRQNDAGAKNDTSLPNSPNTPSTRRGVASTVSTADPRYDVVLASDVLYDEASAAPLAGTLRDLLAPTPSPRKAERTNARTNAVCFLAWRPRAASPNKASAVRAFLAACAARRLRVREAPPDGKKTASAAKAVLRASDASNATRGWVESLTARDAAERGVRVLRIEAVEEGYT
jgi:predicted nicotinamide N-methyase